MTQVYIYFYNINLPYEHVSISVHGQEFSYSDRGVEIIVEDCPTYDRRGSNRKVANGFGSFSSALPTSSMPSSILESGKHQI